MVKYLDLSSNSLFNQIPKAFGMSKFSLEVLDLSCNNLSGAIPYSLGKLQYIISINMSFNHLEGEIPSSCVFLNPSNVSFVGNTGLYGALKLGYPPCSTSARIYKSWKRTRLN